MELKRRSDNSKRVKIIDYRKTTFLNDRNDIDKLYSEMTWFHFYQVSVTKNKGIERKHIRTKEIIKKVKRSPDLYLA